MYSFSVLYHTAVIEVSYSKASYIRPWRFSFAAHHKTETGALGAVSHTSELFSFHMSDNNLDRKATCSAGRCTYNNVLGPGDCWMLMQVRSIQEDMPVVTDNTIFVIPIRSSL